MWRDSIMSPFIDLFLRGEGWLLPHKLNYDTELKY